MVLFASCAGSPETSRPASTPTPAPTSTLIPNLDTTLTKFDPGLPPNALKAPVVGTVPDNQILHISVAFKLDQNAINQIGKNSKLPEGSSKSATEMANTLGINEAVVKKVQAYFGIQDATVKAGKLRTDLTIDIKAGSAATLLKTKFLLHELNGRQFYAPDPKQPPMLPKFVLDNAVAITGLDTYSSPPEKHSTLSAQNVQAAHTMQHSQASCLRPGANPGIVESAALAHAYGYDQFWNKGIHGEQQTISIITFDGFDQNDIANYFTCVGFRGTLKAVNVITPAPKPEGETTLDIEMIAGMAPSANIVVYMLDQTYAQTQTEAANAYLDVLQRVIDDNANNKTGGVVTTSWGSAEELKSSNYLAAVHQRFEIMTQVEHLTVFASSGDCGAFNMGIYNLLSVDYPASDPAVVGVGGTTLTLDNKNTRAKEIAWSNGENQSACKNSWGTGGGVSTRIEQPKWQNAPGVNNKYAHGMRQVPDVSAVATNLPVYYNGEWLVAGGTSAAAPIWAAGWTLVNQELKTAKQTLIFSPEPMYWVVNNAGENKTPYFDVTEGNNLYYKATPGWDQPTGIGTPNLYTIYKVIADSI
ncbi:S53 family peptidase [Dictyobacter formicarum]|uniref:S53 family peptidase n=1 Tax=Dictyobacter formicarum TaxID=2778368 RepID=UPI00191636F7|nr:S53 family peptidase [Dictyobacter formicarum]